jgi:hypothetical protein
MKVDIEIPESLNEITLDQYQRYLKIQDNNEDEKFLAVKMIEIFCGIRGDHVLLMRATDINSIVQILTEMLNNTPKLQTMFKMKDTQYGFIPKLDDMSFGEYIDLDTFIGDWDNMHRAMNVLYRPITNQYGDKYNVEDYSVDNAEKMKDMPMSAVLGSIVFFLQFRDGLIESYAELFGERGNELSPTSNFGRKWGWYQSLYALAQGDIGRFEDITKLNAHQCLYALSFMKDKAELEARQIKSKFNG